MSNETTNSPYIARFSALTRWGKEHPIPVGAAFLVAILGFFGDIQWAFEILMANQGAIAGFVGGPYFPLIELIVIVSTIVLMIIWAAARDTKKRSIENDVKDMVASETTAAQERVLNEVEKTQKQLLDRITKHTNANIKTFEWWVAHHKKNSLIAANQQARRASESIEKNILRSSGSTQSDRTFGDVKLTADATLDSFRDSLLKMGYTEGHVDKELFVGMAQLAAVIVDGGLDDRHEKLLREVKAKANLVVKFCNEQVRKCDRCLDRLDKKIRDELAKKNLPE